MNRAKYDVLRAALERIALGQNGKAKDLAIIATTALRDAAQVIEYRITARTWFGKNGGEFRAELTSTDTGETIIDVAGTTWGSDAWAYAMRDAMGHKPHLFPAPNGGHPTIYFRDVCRVEYEHAEVSRKRDL